MENAPTLLEALAVLHQQPRAVRTQPAKVFQLMGHVPDVATCAHTKGEARAKLAQLIGLDKLPAGSVVERIK